MSRRSPLLVVPGLVALAASLTSADARAATVNVTTPTELKTAIQGAKAGDEIVLADGTYALNANVTCGTDGSTTPIVVRAENALKARIDFDALEGFKVTAPGWHFEGLDVHGACADDNLCEHAFHVTGKATGFVLRNSRVVDFNAQIKVNAENQAGTWFQPNDGLVEYNEFFDTQPRDTSNPVTKVNIDTVDRWVVRGNVIHDFQRASGGVTYGAFMKGGGKDGIFERNLVLCQRDLAAGPTATIGLSFGGGGTAPQYCAPAFTAGTPCTVENERGILRNNVIANCSDVGVYLNQSKDTRLLFNTLIGTTGVEFRFPSSSGEAKGNVMTSQVRRRDSAQAPLLADNLVDVSVATFQAMYVDPLVGDLRKKGDLSALLGKSLAGNALVPDDYCARARPSGGPLDLGALQASLGDCVTLVPPVGLPGGGESDAGAGIGGPTTEPKPGGGGGALGNDVTPSGNEDPDDAGCGISARGPSGADLAVAAAFATLALAVSRRRRR